MHSLVDFLIFNPMARICGSFKIMDWAVMASQKHKAFLIIVVRCIDIKRILSKTESQQTSFNRQKCVKQESKIKGETLILRTVG